MIVLQSLLMPMLLMLFLQQACGYNFCNNKNGYCEKAATKHFMCRLKSELTPMNNQIQLIGVVPDTYLFRDRILHAHNSFRNKVASGKLLNKNNELFPSASRMRELAWDLELAYMARMHVGAISFKHSLCRSVKRFPVVGESMTMFYVPKQQLNVSKLLEMTLGHMFSEYWDIDKPATVVDSFDIAQHPEALADFAMLISDRVSRVGCGFAIAKNCQKNLENSYCYMMTCYYDYNTIAGSYIYKRGRPASVCGIWLTSPSLNYLNLCANSGLTFNSKTGSQANNKENMDD